MIQGFISPEALVLLFFFFGLALAVAIRNLQKVYAWVPYTPTLFVVSLLLGITCESTGIIGESIKQMSSIDPHGILLIFLPPLIFESSFNSDWYIFRKQSVQIFILAFPAVLVSALLLMLSIKMVIGYDESYYSMSEAFMFGSVLSCTDTVAVLALLKEAGAPRKFSSLIEGESLLNDGTCMILFTISLELVKGNSPPPLRIVQLFLELTIGAIVLGVLFGFLSAKLIQKVRNDAVLTLNITVASSYLVYFVAQYVDLGIKVSGIMALVALGLYMAAFGKTKIAHEAAEMVQNFWRTYIFIAESTIFILGGAIVGVQGLKSQFVSVLNADNILKLFLLYLCMNVCRFLSIAVFMPKLQSEGYGLKWKQVAGLTYGGLRGAVGIAFTLILASHGQLNPKFRMVSLLNTSGCAFLTLVINAPSCSWFIQKLGVCTKSDAKIRFFRKFMRQCEYDMNKLVADMKKNKHLGSASWDKVEQQSGMTELRSYIQASNSNLADRSQSNIEMVSSSRAHISLHQSLLDPSAEDLHGVVRNKLFESIEFDPSLMSEIRNRYCVALKGILWEKFQDNQCSSESIRVLIQCVNIDMDTLDEPLSSWEYLISHMHNPYFFPICYWLKNRPIIGSYAFSWIYDRVILLYDVISTYLDALQDCEEACKSLPYDQYLQMKVVEESSQNRKLAQSFLDHQIKVSYFEIMKRIQTTKAAQSILTYQKEIIHISHQYGQIDGPFYKLLTNAIQSAVTSLENDSETKEAMKDIDVLKQSEFFNELSETQLKRLLQTKIDQVVQKDESLVKSYEKQKYLYLIVRGEVVEEYKNEGKTVYQRSVGMYHLAGIGGLLINRMQLEYTAVAQSVVSVFGFALSEIRDLVSQKFKLEQILQNDIFMLQIRLEPEILKTLDITETQWKKRKNQITFKRLTKDQTFQVQSAYLVLIFGKITIGDSKHVQGCFSIKDTAVVEGPAKFYYISLSVLNEDEIRKSSTDLIRGSLSKQSRISANSKGPSGEASIIRRTLFSK